MKRHILGALSVNSLETLNKENIMVFSPVDPELLSSLIEASEDETETEEIVKCEYFAMCDNDAVGTVPNPVLGPVPCCKRCADKVGYELV